MHKTAVALATGKLMQVMGLVLIVPLAIAFYDDRSLGLLQAFGRPETLGFVIAIAFSLIFGTAVAWLFRSARELQGTKEGYAVVTIGWMMLTLISSIPFCLYFMEVRPPDSNGFMLAFTDSFFEVMSGFTTTGASILTDIEAVPRSLLFLRALTHWLGGMGIITLALAIFPAMGVSGYQMFRGEVPGPSKDKLGPRLTHTASILWGVYCLLTAVETGLLMIAGMDWFEAICHSFATMATGGFSTRNASVAGFESDWITWIISLFMFLAGVNFVLHFKALRGDIRAMTDNREFRFYTGVILVAIVLVSAVLYFGGPKPVKEASDHWRHHQLTAEEFIDHHQLHASKYTTVYGTVREATFQVLSITTTTGFATTDFDIWPDFLRILMIVLMFFGGCAGSTGGGMKMIRIMVVFKMAINELRKLTFPRLVAPLKIGSSAVDDKMSINIVSFSILFVGLFALVAILMTLFVPDLTTAVAASIATIGNIGPGLSGVGAVENYSWIPIPGKWILVVSMLLGRLEIFTVLIVLRPATWRK
ncbi:MAG TPA: potassium transporter TrkG [candidate division Zixibacteria bacterium]|nr:potassium transporter TrkG [candidate division Zixibacteria bacterium]